MKAMVLAAGLGTRLRPLTNDRPKALVELSGRTLLEITLSRLRAFGIKEVILNVHHHASLVIEYLAAHKNFGMRIEISREERLLDTGGGLKNAAWFFQASSGSKEPFLLHNVDVISSIDLGRMVDFHSQTRSLATLAVQDRKSSRPLLFDQESRLCGRASEDPRLEPVGIRKPLQRLAFCGIHLISPRLFELMTEEGEFSIISTYVRLAAQGEPIRGFRADDFYWRDLGKPEHIAQAEQDLQAHMLGSFSLPV
ncbi:MAG: nucleotidyltransferase family protein [Acidobacteria bacterium]|nr:nucleotidyltransferase family protein [Acidobacteriota bacterium]